jgi:hypothetical protein
LSFLFAIQTCVLCYCHIYFLSFFLSFFLRVDRWLIDLMKGFTNWVVVQQLHRIINWSRQSVHSYTKKNYAMVHSLT